MRKEQRRNQSNQVRKNKREDAMNKKRSIGGSTTAPFLVCLLPLNETIDPNSALSMIQCCDAEAVVTKTLSGVTHISIPRFKQRFSFIVPAVGKGNELTVLDCLKVCDTTVLLVSAINGEDDVFDRWSHKILNMAIAQGLPTPIVSLMDLESIAPKKRGQIRTGIQKTITKSLPTEKCMNLDTNADAFNLLRRIGGQKKNNLYNKSNRPHLLAEVVEYIPEEEILKVTGFLRGQPLDVNNLVHVPGLGDFQMSQIDAPNDPYKIEKSRDDENIINPTRVLCKSDPIKQLSLMRENIPDEMDAEQTWPAEEEMAESSKSESKKKTIKRVPKGMSDYQACWIPDVEEVSGDDESENDEDDDEEEDDFMSCDSNADSEEEMGNKDDVEDDEECDSVTVSDAPVNDEKYDQEMDLEDERKSLLRIKEARTDQQWPDEIDTPADVPARDRFSKYRGLESFRTSPWDVKENLPSDYARVFQFKNFDRTKRRILKETEDAEGALPGWYITISISNVSQNLWNSFKSAQLSNLLVVYGMLPHENQMSVMNTILKRTPDSTIPIQSKEKMIIQCGYRRFIVNPIFSQHTNSDKHKYERYFRPNTTVAATFYAPIQFPPSPLLCFKENPDSTLGLVATGMLMSCNPDRIVLKRVVLSGHPLKINRRYATIRYMFFNKEDVDYFKPVKLRTRCGRLGHIKESLGTHGHMKCYFDGQIKSFDSIFLYLYKRVFPKWTYEDCVVSCKTDDSSMLE